MFRSKLLIMQKLLNTSAHLGYRTAFSNYQPYLYGFRNEIAIIDLDKTLICLRRACSVIELIVRSNGHILFVNTNVEYNNIVQQTATQTGQSYINHKWIGGLLTNWNHMQNVQRHFKHFAADRVPANDSAVLSHRVHSMHRHVPEAASRTSAAFRSEPFFVPFQADSRAGRAVYKPGYPAGFRAKKAVTPQREQELPTSAGATVLCSACTPEALKANYKKKGFAAFSVFRHTSSLRRTSRLLLKVAPRFKKMQKCFEGIVAKDLPDCVIILNANLNSNAIQEAKRLQIPIIALVDSNVSNSLHNMIAFPIPANGDCFQFIYLLCNCILKTILYSKSR
uniref:ribosomal protein S2 n=1 Tax=Zygnema cf. cylindricum TaxID=3142258 RepID=UPI0031F34AA8